MHFNRAWLCISTECGCAFNRVWLCILTECDCAFQQSVAVQSWWTQIKESKSLSCLLKRTCTGIKHAVCLKSTCTGIKQAACVRILTVPCYCSSAAAAHRDAQYLAHIQYTEKAHIHINRKSSHTAHTHTHAHTHAHTHTHTHTHTHAHAHTHTLSHTHTHNTLLTSLKLLPNTHQPSP